MARRQNHRPVGATGCGPPSGDPTIVWAGLRCRHPALVRKFVGVAKREGDAVGSDGDCTCHFARGVAGIMLVYALVSYSSVGAAPKTARYKHSESE